VGRRSYREFCSIARALDVVGERWTILIVRNLLLAPRRYTDLLDDLPGITTNLLAKRLKEMAAGGLIQHTPPNLYSLTGRGRALEPVLLALAGWARPLMDRPHRDDTLNPGWPLVPLVALYRGGVRFELELRADGRVFELSFLPDELRVLERAAARPDAVVSCSGPAMRRLFFGVEPLAALLHEGAIEAEGDLRGLRAALDALRSR
jgi:DNA-binding HxlR family transcriptional regulator